MYIFVHMHNSNDRSVTPEYFIQPSESKSRYFVSSSLINFETYTFFGGGGGWVGGPGTLDN